MPKKKTIDQLDIFAGKEIVGYLSEALNSSDLGTFQDKIRAGCNVCKEIKSEVKTLPVVFKGNTSSNILIVGQGPGQNEDVLGIPFCGSSGKYLDTLLKQSGMHPERDCVMTNTVLCHFGRREPPPDAFHNCRPYFQKIVELTKPKVILSLGLQATKELCNVPEEAGAHNIVGSWMNSRYDIPTFCIYHPAFIMRPEGRRYEQQTKTHLKAFVEQAKALGCNIIGYTWQDLKMREVDEYYHPEEEVLLYDDIEAIRKIANGEI